MKESEEFKEWWYKNHPFDWWAKERDGEPLPHRDRLLVRCLVADAYDNALTTTRLEAVREANDRATRNFRWAYQLLLALAKRRLADANADRESENDWPAGQRWHEMVGTSHSIFLRGAREEAGIPEEAFMGIIRSLECDVDDLYEAAAKEGSGK